MLGLLIYSITFLGYMGHAVWTAPRAAATSAGFSTRYRFAFGHLRSSCWWWCLIETGFAFSLVLVQALASNMYITIFLIVLLVIVTATAEFYTRPYKSVQNNYTSIIMKYCMLTCALFLTAFVDGDTTAQDMAVIVIVFAATVPLCLATLNILTHSCLMSFCREPDKLCRTVYFAQTFRDVLVALLLMPDSEFLQCFDKLDEEDYKSIRRILDILVGVFLQMQAGEHMRRQRIMTGLPFRIWEPEALNMQATSAALMGNLQAAVEKSSRTQIALITFIQEFKRLNEKPDWPRQCAQRHWLRHVLQCYRGPMVQQVTKEEFVQSCSSKVHLTEEELAQIFDALDCTKAGVLPMPSLLEGFVKNTCSFNRSQLLHLNSLRVRASDNRDGSSHASGGKEDHDEAPVAAKCMLITEEVEPVIDDDDEHHNKAAPACRWLSCS